MGVSNVDDILAQAEAAAAATPAAAPVAPATSGVTDMVPSSNGTYAVAQPMAAAPASMEAFMASGLAPDKFIQPDKAKYIAVGKEGMYESLVVGIDLSNEGNSRWVFQTSFGNPVGYYSANDRNGLCIENGKPWHDIIAEGAAVSKALGKAYRGDYMTCKLYMVLLADTKDMVGKHSTPAGTTLGYTPTVTTAKNLAVLTNAIARLGTGKLRVKLTSAYTKNASGEWGALCYEVLGPWDGVSLDA